MAAIVRTREELRHARHVFFESFPGAGATDDIARYQVALVGEIKATEVELQSARSTDQKEHLHLLRIYGDALAARG
jgi:hypothetical protein